MEEEEEEAAPEEEEEAAPDAEDVVPEKSECDGGERIENLRHRNRRGGVTSSSRIRLNLWHTDSISPCFNFQSGHSILVLYVLQFQLQARINARTWNNTFVVCWS